MNARTSSVAVVLLIACSAVLTGCPPEARVAVCPGPPLAAEAELVAQNNANAAKVPSLRADADVEISYVAEGQERSERLRDGMLLLLKRPGSPADVPSFLLRAVLVSEPYFGAGVDAAAGEHYFWLDPPRGASVARWGLLENLDRPDWEMLPVDPVDLLSVLAVLEWPVNDRASPILSMPKDDPCLYDLLFFGGAGGAGGVRLRRQVWLDRTQSPPRPTRVWLFDAWGEVTVDATLSDYRRIDALALPAAQRPVMPTDILLRYPREQVIRSLRLRLSNMTVGTEDVPVRPEMFERRRVVPPGIDDQRPLGPATQPAVLEAQATP